MIFFRDPYDASKENMPEQVYMLTYETFVRRLVDTQGYRFFQNNCPNEINFGLISQMPAKLYC